MLLPLFLLVLGLCLSVLKCKHVKFPRCSAIFWSVTDADGSGRIMRAPMDGSHSATIVGYQADYRHARARRAAPDCDCPGMAVTPVFAMDHSRTTTSEIYTIQKRTGSIWAADLHGCRCRLVVNATGRPDLGEWPPLYGSRTRYNPNL